MEEKRCGYHRTDACNEKVCPECLGPGRLRETGTQLRAVAQAQGFRHSIAGVKAPVSLDHWIYAEESPSFATGEEGRTCA